MNGSDIAALLGLSPLPDEGGLFRRTYCDDYSGAIYYLLADGDFSALHLLTGAEVYHFYAGAPLRLLLLDPATGHGREVLLGNDFAAGQRPQLVVPAGVWQGSASLGPWTLVGTTMAPPFSDDGFTLGQRADLTDRFGQFADQIAALTRQ